MVSVGAYAGAECRRASRAPRASFGMIADRAYDSARLRTALGEEGLELVCPHRRGRRRKATQDDQKVATLSSTLDRLANHLLARSVPATDREARV